MYCPRCGYQTASEELRFCSYCGLKLAVVKAALADGEEVPATTLTATKNSLPALRQRDMSVGMLLMFAATMFAGFLTTWPGLLVSRATSAVIFTMLYLAILVLSNQITKVIHKLLSWEESDAELASGQRGVCLGATFMFLTTILLAFGSLFMFGRVKTTEFFVGLGFALPFCLLVSQYLTRGLRYLVQGEPTVALPREASVPVSLFETRKVQRPRSSRRRASPSTPRICSKTSKTHNLTCKST